MTCAEIARRDSRLGLGAGSDLSWAATPLADRLLKKGDRHLTAAALCGIGVCWVRSQSPFSTGREGQEMGQAISARVATARRGKLGSDCQRTNRSVSLATGTPMTFANRDGYGVFGPMWDSIATGKSTQRAHPHSTVPARGITAPVPKPSTRGGIFTRCGLR